MKLWPLLLAVCLATPLCVVSQSNVQRNFKGRVVDTSFKPLGDASVCIYRAVDTALLNFGFTTPNGNYSISTKSPDSLIIIISLMGFHDHVIRQGPEEGWSFMSFPDVKLKPAPLEISKVVARSAAIRMKGDTIEINASRFKVLPGSDVAQLFKKIPGFEVSVKGEIKVNGTQVSKILVDGSDFFGNNPGMVSKNLSADMIETVQVFEDVNEDGTPKEDPAKVINLKLKKGKRNGTFGDVMGGYGTRERYESGLRLNNFKNDRKLSFIVNSNNTNQTGFDFGFDNWHSATQTSRNGNGNNYDFFYWGSDNHGGGNINNKLDGGFTYFNEYSRKRKLSFNAFAGRNKYNSLNSSLGINSLNDSTERSNADSSTIKGLEQNMSFSASYTKNIDSTGMYDFGITTSAKQDRNTTDAVNVIRLNSQEINRGISQNMQLTTTRDLTANASVRRYLRKNKGYMFFASGSYTMNDYNSKSYQFQRNTLDTFNNLNNRTVNGTELLFKVLLRMPIYKKEMHFNLSADRWQQDNVSEQVATSANNPFSGNFEQSYSTRIDSLSTKFINSMVQYTIKPYLSYSTKSGYATAGITLLQLDLQNRNENNQLDIPRHYTKALPYFTYSYYPKDKMWAYLGFFKSTDFPTITDLMPILNISNNYERQAGNKDLNPQDNYSFTARSSFYRVKGFRQLYFSFQGKMSDNAKIYASRQNAEGILISSPENASGQRSLTGYVGGSKKLSKVFAFNLYTDANINRDPIIINNTRGFSNKYGLHLRPGLAFVRSDSFDFSVGMDILSDKYSNSINSLVNYTQLTYGYNISIRGIFATGTEVSSNLDIQDQRNVPSIGRIVPVWNAFIQQPLDKKGSYNLKLTAYDILRKNTSINRTAIGNFVYITQSNQLQQYFMLTLVYKIKKMGGQEEPQVAY